MPMAIIDNISIRYDKEKHIRNHFDVACQVRPWIGHQTFTIWNEGADKDYTYLVQNLRGAWRVHTRQVWIDRTVFKNVVCQIDDLIIKDETSSGNPRYFS